MKLSQVQSFKKQFRNPVPEGQSAESALEGETRVVWKVGFNLAVRISAMEQEEEHNNGRQVDLAEEATDSLMREVKSLRVRLNHVKGNWAPQGQDRQM